MPVLCAALASAAAPSACASSVDLAGVLEGVLEERVAFLSGGPGSSAALAPEMMISRSSAKESFAAVAGSWPAAAAAASSA